MALTGNIADWSLADILQIVGAERKSGTLTLFNDRDEVRLAFHEGRIVGADHQSSLSGRREGRGKAGRSKSSRGTLDRGLLSFLVANGRIEEAQARAVTKLARETGEDQLAALERAELLSPAELAAAMGEYIQDLIYQVLTWQSGEYSFATEKTSSPGTQPTHSFGTEALLLEAMRRIDELPRIDEVVRPDTIFHRTGGSAELAVLGGREGNLLKLIDGTSDVRSLSRRAKLTEFEAAETLFNLHEAGLIEASTKSESDALLDLSLADLESTPRRAKPLHLLSLMVLIAASIAFRLASHGILLPRLTERRADPTPSAGYAPLVALGLDDRDPRTLVALELARALFRESRGREAESVDELRRAGLLAGGPFFSFGGGTPTAERPPATETTDGQEAGR